MGRGLVAGSRIRNCGRFLSIVLSVSAMADGEAYGFTRAAIGLVGIAAGLLVLSGKDLGIDGWRGARTLGRAADAGLRRRKGRELLPAALRHPGRGGSSTTINGVVTEYSQIGINLVGVALLIIVFRLRERWNLSQRARARSLAMA